VYASLRAAGKKADLSLIVADEPAVAGGCFTKNVMCAAPVLYCKDVLARKKKVKAVRSVHRLEACSACISPVHATHLLYMTYA
jgi:N-acetylglutamate synthase/N-acetylornithine aminotransferase